MWSGPNSSPARTRTSHCLYLWLLHVISNLQNGGHSGLHPACLVNAGLSLKVASGLEFQAFIRTLRDTRAPTEGLFKTSTKPVLGKHTVICFFFTLHIFNWFSFSSSTTTVICMCDGFFIYYLYIHLKTRPYKPDLLVTLI